MDQRAEPKGAVVVTKQGQLGGARADFVSALGRRVAELVVTLKQLQGDPGSARLRDDLRRRIHALAAGARLLRFALLAEELAASEAMLDAAAQRGELRDEDRAALLATLDRVPALAWGHASANEPPTPPPPVVEVTPSPSALGRPIEPGAISFSAAATSDEAILGPAFPHSVLVVGPSSLGDALGHDMASPSGPSGTAFEVERTEDNFTAIDLARALAPDLIVVDVDREGARALVEALLADPLTEPVPIVVVGLWQKADEAAPYVALGVAKAIARPVSPDALRRACAEVAATYVRREIAREPLGTLTLDQLGSRLAEELQRGLCDAAAKGRGARIDLGEGSEVLAALWGAVARVRDLVTIRSAGEVRFSPTGPEGALPLVPWIGEGEAAGAAARALAPADARIAGEARLDKLTIVVADDDAAVLWFLAGVLRAAGATVHEAHDGARALELSHATQPDLVVSDIIMPAIDGFALCRALKRDVALRDTPVILLSWKEDLLQRVRELGADADGYLRKEASAAVIVQRVREVLRPRRRVAERLGAGGEVRGRLDGLTTRTLLALCCTHRTSSTLTVRDASFLYEIEIRGGRPARATRTAPDGTFQRGAAVLAAMLGVGSGRFVVADAEPTSRLARAELEGSLSDQLRPAIAAARAAQRLLSGAALVHVERVSIEEDILAIYLESTPEPARSLLRTLAAGASPRALITSGQASARLVEDVLCDAAAHGAITEIIDRAGTDALFPAIERELAVLRGVRFSMPVLAPPPSGVGSLDATEELDEADIEVDHESQPVVLDARAQGARPLAGEGDPKPAPSLVDAVPSLSAPPPPARIMTLGSLTPPPIAAPPPAPKARVGVAAPPPPPAVAERAEPAPRPAPEPASEPHRAPRPSSYYSARQPTPAEPPRSAATTWILLAVAGVAFAVAARWAREPHVVPEPTPAVAALAPAALQPAPVEAPAASPAPTGKPDDASSETPTAQDLPLRTEDRVPDGQGMLEVVAGAKDAIYVDGRLIGEGPIQKLPLAPRKEPYEVRVKLRGEERVRFVPVKEGRLARLRVAPPWSR